MTHPPAGKRGRVPPAFGAPWSARGLAGIKGLVVKHHFHPAPTLLTLLSGPLSLWPPVAFLGGTQDPPHDGDTEYKGALKSQKIIGLGLASHSPVTRIYRRAALRGLYF